MILSVLTLLSVQAAASTPPKIISVIETPQPEDTQPPVPKYPIQKVVSPMDYPVGAKGRGIVGLTLLVDRQGIARSCEITQSGGSPELDFATCNLVKRRARFNPATDRFGNPTFGRAAVQIDWNQAMQMRRVHAN